MKYSKEFKEQAIKLSDEIGVKQACAQFGLVYELLQIGEKPVIENAF